MNYFTGSFYGNLDAYNKMKQKLKLKENDMLWILGDVLDGDNASPQDCLAILDDIKKNGNIQLLLGDHEFAHIMRYISKEDKESYDSWKNYLLSMNESAEEMLSLFEEGMSEYEEDLYFSFLIEQCEITRLLHIGDNYFYIVHGFPSAFQGSLTKWQFAVSTNEEITGNFLNDIKKDPSFSKEELAPLTKQNTFVICSHAARSQEAKEGGIIHNNGVFLISNNVSKGRIPVLGIDAAGYFFKTIL